MSEQAEIEVADELVDEASITDGKAVVRFSKTEAALADLEKRFKGVTFDLATTKGDAAARQARKELVTLRTNLERRRKELAVPAVEFKRRIDSEAQRISSAVVALEEPIDAAIKQDEQRRENERVERLRMEEARCDGHRQRIADLSAVATRAVGLSSAEIAAKQALLTRVVLDESYEEFFAAAVNAKAEALLSLAQLFSNAELAEAKEAEAKRNAERLAQLERENAERLAREAEERRQREVAEAEARRVEQERLAAEHRAQQKRAAQSDAARDLIDEIRRIQQRAFTASAAGMLQLVTLVEAIAIGDELGDYAGSALSAKDVALHDLHAMHLQTLTREADAKRVREEQAEAQRKIDAAAAELQARVDAMNREELRLQAIERENEEARQRELRAEQESSEQAAAEPIEPEPAPPAPPPPAPDVPPVEVVGAVAEPVTGEQQVHGGGPSDIALPTAIDEETTCVPILIGFDQTKPIGWLKIKTSALPATPDFVFSLGFEALEMAGLIPGSVPSAWYVSRYKLQAVAPQTDRAYIGYMQQIGMLPSEAQATAAAALKHAVVNVMKTATPTGARGRKPGPWVVPLAEMLALKAALRAVPLPGGQYYAEDGTLMKADGSRSIFDDVAA